MRARLVLLLAWVPLLAGLAVSGPAGTGARAASGLSCDQFLARTPASAQQARTMRTPPLAALRGRTCTEDMGGRTVRVPLASGEGVLYSGPLFCTKNIPGPYCVNARNLGTTAGTRLQMWERTGTTRANLGSWFTAYRFNWVTIKGQNGTHSWPARWPLAWKREYYGWAGINLEKMTSRGYNSGNCVTTAASRTYRASNGIEYFWPIDLGRCSTSSVIDGGHTMMVWLRDNPSGYRITPAVQSANVKFLTHLSCIYTTPATNCGDGDDLITSAPGTPYWEPWEFPSAKG